MPLRVGLVALPLLLAVRSCLPSSVLVRQDEPRGRRGVGIEFDAMKDDGAWAGAERKLGMRLATGKLNTIE